jgi:hypothetical protein
MVWFAIVTFILSLGVLCFAVWDMCTNEKYWEEKL